MTHLDTEILAEFRAGLITGRRGGKIAAHLAGCDHCTALDSQLTRVSALLTSVPTPVLPDRVADRLDAVLAAEVASRDDPERAGREHAPTPGAPARRAAHRGFRLPSLRALAPVVAAAAVVLAAGGYGLSLLAHGPGSQATAAAAGGAANSVARTANRTAGSVAGPMASAPHSGASIRSQRESPASFLVIPTSTNFRAAGLEQQLESALKVAPAAGAGQLAPSQVQACVHQVAGSAALLRVLLAHYEGHPAAIIVARTAQGQQEAWVVDCSGTHPHVLNQASLP